MFSRLVAFTCSVSARVRPRRRSRENCAFSWRLPGPMIMLRRALPNVPGRRDAEGGGVEEQIDGRVRGPGPARRRSWRAACRWCRVATSLAAPVTRGVSGVPDCQVNVVAAAPVLEQRRPEAAVVQPRPVRAERQLDADVARQLVAAIEAREPPFRVEVAIVLGDDRCRRRRSRRRCRASGRACR